MGLRAQHIIVDANVPFLASQSPLRDPLDSTSTDQF